MRRVFLATAFAAAFGASPASATLQIAAQIGPDSFFCADNMSCDLNPALGVIELADTTLDGVSVDGSVQLSAHGAEPSLSTSSLSIDNATAAPISLTVAVSDTDFVPISANFVSSTSGTWQGPGGSSVSLGWFVDPANAQGADTAFDAPGSELDTFSVVSGSPTDSFSHTASNVLVLTSPFSMTDQATISLAPGEALINRGQSFVGTAVPELSTWAMILLGLGLLAPFWRKNRERMRLT